MIHIEQLRKSFGGTEVLKGVDLRLTGGTSHVLLGPSGCGKSTLLRLILGLEAPSSGRVQVDQKPVPFRDSNEFRTYVCQFGYLIQEGGIFPHLTAYENVSLAARCMGKPEQEIHDRIKILSDLVGLSLQQLERFPVQLSGGQRQRVGLMRALFLDPKILLLDEPLAALDPVTRSELQRELKNIFSELKKTVVWVTHDLSEAALFGETVTLFREGQIEQSGPFLELARSPKSSFVKEFFQAQKPPAVLQEIQ